MNKLQFRQLVREEIKKVLKESPSHDNGDYAASGEEDGVYEMLGPVGEAQKAFDTEFGWVMRELMEIDEMQGYMNRYNSFESPEDIKNFNKGAIAYFTNFITKLKAINTKIK